MKGYAIFAEGLISYPCDDRMADAGAAPGEALIGTSAEGIVTRWNQAAARLFGYSAEEALGKPIRFVLERRVAETERLSDLKSQFVGSVSHELRTPLHTIIGFSELLAEQREGPLNDRQKRFLEHIQSDAERLLGLINNLLDLGRAEGGKLSVSVEKIAVETVIDESIAGMQAAAAEKPVLVRGGCERGLQARADPIRLRQVLDSLLCNAVKFTPPGGEVTVDAIVEDGFVRISVSDTGIGIAAEERQRIFENFHQVGFTTAGLRVGTGVGLAIAKQLVALQGGRIWVDSAPGRGSQFHFTLPI